MEKDVVIEWDRIIFLYSEYFSYVRLKQHYLDYYLSLVPALSSKENRRKEGSLINSSHNYAHRVHIFFTF